MTKHDLAARLAHGLTALAAAPLRRSYSGPVPPELLVEPGVRWVETSRGTFHTLTWGEGADLPVALLHGLNANARYWTGAACVLGARGFRVLALDQRGHGGTGPLAGGYRLEQTRANLLAWLDAFDLERIDLVGHSWGGKVAADFALAAPERVRRLALVDPVPLEGLHGLIDRFKAFRRGIFAPERGPFGDAEELTRAHATISWLRHAEPWMHAAFDANFTARADGGFNPVLDDEAFDSIYADVLRRPAPLVEARAELPALLVRATFSVMPFSSQVRRLQIQLPRLEETRLRGEHSLHATNPVGLANVLAQFLG